MPTAFGSRPLGRCMASSMPHSSPHTKRLLNLVQTLSLSLARSSKEKKSTRWIPSVPIEDSLVNDNIWSLGKATPALKILGNPSHIWLMLGSFFEHTNWDGQRIFLRLHPSNSHCHPTDSWIPHPAILLLLPNRFHLSIPLTACFRLLDSI